MAVGMPSVAIPAIALALAAAAYTAYTIGTTSHTIKPPHPKKPKHHHVDLYAPEYEINSDKSMTTGGLVVRGVVGMIGGFSMLVDRGPVSKQMT